MTDRGGGFTLMETLVVLVLVGLVSALVYQSTAFLLLVHDRAQAHLKNQQEQLLGESWLVSSVGGLLPDYSLPFGGVVGDTQQLEFDSLGSLHGNPGVPERIRWVIESDGRNSALRYLAEGVDWQVLTRRGALRFRYRDTSGEWLESWPPKAGVTRLPSAVGLAGAEQLPVFLPVTADWAPSAVVTAESP